MWVLHTRNDDDGSGALTAQPKPHRTRDSRGHFRQSLSLHRLCQYRQSYSICCREIAGIRTGPGQCWRRKLISIKERRMMATEVFKHGLGEPYKRKEDARFIRGQGNYVDDVQLPGMLYGDIVRSPYAHALIKNIDISRAMEVPGVVAVITGKDLDAAGLAWMPTLSADTEAVLALERVHFQMQEVAFVVATSRYAAADGVASVEVDYEPLHVLVDPKKAPDPDAPLLRPS